jgi:CBS domain-containing protein
MSTPLCSRSVATVGTIMSREVLDVSPETTLAAAAKKMSGGRVGAVLVLEDGKLRGIVTERDVLRAVGEGRVEGSTAADWMTTDPETIEPSESTEMAATLMIHGGFRHLPVVEGGSVIGVISIRDLMRVVLDDAAPRGV